MTTEFCWKCEATVDVHRVRGSIVCDNCNTRLFDKDGNDVQHEEAV